MVHLSKERVEELLYDNGWGRIPIERMTLHKAEIVLDVLWKDDDSFPDPESRKSKVFLTYNAAEGRWEAEL